MALLNVYSISVALVFFQLIPAILSWGEAGHYATCKIAQDYLTEAAKDAMKELLPESANGELADVCSCPDLREIRKGYPWSGELHFANTPEFGCGFDYCRDCHNAANVKNRCVIGAVYNYTLQLESVYHHYGAYSKYNLTEALMFLAHFMGDLHQPLHLGYVEDLGGNRIIISWFNKTTNLHRVWDDEIIDTALERYYGSNLTNLIEAIKRNITDDRLSEIKSSEACLRSVCPNHHFGSTPFWTSLLCIGSFWVWICFLTGWVLSRAFAFVLTQQHLETDFITCAEESISLACKYAYKDATNGTQLNDDYFHSRLPIVEKRLAQGGVRLAALLEEIFGAKSKKLMQTQKQVISAI